MSLQIQLLLGIEVGGCGGDRGGGGAGDGVCVFFILASFSKYLIFNI